MLLKLCRMELKQSWRPFALIYALLIISSFLIGFNGTRMNTFNSIVLIFYLACIFAVMIMVMVNIIRNYYQSMFGRTSYLTHTLPISTHQLLLSKVISGLLWGIVSFIVIMITIVILAIMISQYIPNFSDIGYLLDNLELFQLDNLLIIVNVLLEYTQSILLVFLAMTFVNSCYVRKYRVPLGLGIYVAINLLISYLLNQIFRIPSANEFFLLIANTRNTFGMNHTGNICLSLAINLILCCLYFFATNYILDKKLEVE